MQLVFIKGDNKTNSQSSCFISIWRPDQSLNLVHLYLHPCTTAEHWVTF